MQTFKIQHFERDKPGCSFPWFESLDVAETRSIRALLARKSGLPETVAPLSLSQRLDDFAKVVAGVNAKAEDFDLASVLRSQGIEPQPEACVNWYRYDDVDRMHFDDLTENFDDIWYPSSDDINIFDATLSWILSVTHYGVVKMVRLDAK